MSHNSCSSKTKLKSKSDVLIDTFELRSGSSHIYLKNSSYRGVTLLIVLIFNLFLYVLDLYMIYLLSKGSKFSLLQFPI